MSNRFQDRSDANGAGVVVVPGSTGIILAYDSHAYVASYVVKASAGVLHTIFGYNVNAAVRTLQLFDLAALPVDGSIPDFAPIPVPASSNWSVSFPKGRPFANGIILVASTTIATKTISLTNDFWLSGEYE